MNFMMLGLFFVYCLFFILMIKKNGLYNVFGLKENIVVILFLLKVFAGCLYVFIHQHYYGGGDILRFHKNAHWIMVAGAQNPISYIKMVFGFYNGYEPPELFSYTSHMQLWGDNGSFLIVRLIAIFNLLSFENMYINTIFFELITMVGILSFYKVFVDYFPEKKHLLIITIFAIPSTLFWSSGIHKDGVILTCTGLLFLCLNELVTKGFHIVKLLISAVSALIMLMIRGYDLILMIPGLIALYWVYKIPRYRFVKFLVVYLISVVLFFITDDFFSLGFKNFILQKQKMYVVYGLGNSVLRPLMINEHWQSFPITAPHALYRALFRPNIFQYNSWHEFAYAVIHNLYLLGCILLVSIQFVRKKVHSGMALFCLFYAITMMIFIGWIVPNVGAMVRYTSTAYVYLTLFFILISDEKRFPLIKIAKKIE